MTPHVELANKKNQKEQKPELRVFMCLIVCSKKVGRRSVEKKKRKNKRSRGGASTASVKIPSKPKGYDDHRESHNPVSTPARLLLYRDRERSTHGPVKFLVVFAIFLGGVSCQLCNQCLGADRP